MSRGTKGMWVFLDIEFYLKPPSKAGRFFGRLSIITQQSGLRQEVVHDRLVRSVWSDAKF